LRAATSGYWAYTTVRFLYTVLQKAGHTLLHPDGGAVRPIVLNDGLAGRGAGDVTRISVGTP